MADANSQHENEIKLRIDSAGAGRAKLEGAGFRVSTPRVFESNTIYDTAGLTLRERHSLVRLRQAGSRNVLTFKGPAAAGGRHKTREELETEIVSSKVMSQILERLGYAPVFRYEKYRTEFALPAGAGVATLDETPIGCFLELEGPADWIDETAAALGFSDRDYITASYGALYLQWCRERNLLPSNMIFDGPR